MKCAADAGEAPGLIDAQVGDDVGHAEAVERRRLIGEGGIAGHRGIDAESGCVGVHGRGAVVTPRVFERQRAGEAVAELRRYRPIQSTPVALVSPWTVTVW